MEALFRADLDAMRRAVEEPKTLISSAMQQLVEENAQLRQENADLRRRLAECEQH